ncbi:hypothetical protein Y032_0227g2836 [Ancylostoma ceylanicum]|nr:hypothetical protein Y032_0227g2836 [Ancylostoma ceylanicum]
MRSYNPSHKIYNHLRIIIGLRNQGSPVSTIAREVKKIDSSVSYHMIWRFLKKFESSSVPTRSYVPRSLSHSIPEIRNEIDHCYNHNSSTTSNDVVNRLKRKGITISSAHVRRLRKQMGYEKTTAKYCNMIKENNKQTRLEFCRRNLEDFATFRDCVFTDESTVQIDCSTKFCYVRKGNHNPRLRSRAKHPAKLHIWGGISYRGRTHLAIIPGHIRINSRIYCKIIERCLLPFIRKTHNGFARIVQDNAPAHSSRFTQDNFREWGLNAVGWPPESPDLNPIELVWGRMKTAIRSRRIRNLSDLKTAIIENWNTLSPELCTRYEQVNTIHNDLKQFNTLFRELQKQTNETLEQKGARHFHFVIQGSPTKLKSTPTALPPR